MSYVPFSEIAVGEKFTSLKGLQFLRIAAKVGRLGGKLEDVDATLDLNNGDPFAPGLPMNAVVIAGDEIGYLQNFKPDTCVKFS